MVIHQRSFMNMIPHRTQFIIIVAILAAVIIDSSANSQDYSHHHDSKNDEIVSFELPTDTDTHNHQHNQQQLKSQHQQPEVSPPVKRQISNNPNYQYYSFELPNTNTTNFQLPPVEDHFIHYKQPQSQPLREQSQPQPVHRHHSPLPSNHNQQPQQQQQSQYQPQPQYVQSQPKSTNYQDQFNSIRRYPQFQQNQPLTNNEPLISVISGANQFHPSQSVSWNPPPTHFPPPPLSSQQSSSALNSAPPVLDTIRNAPQSSSQLSFVPSSSQSNANQFNGHLVDSSNNQRTNSRSQSQSFPSTLSPTQPSESSTQLPLAYPFQYEDLQSNKSRINFRPGDHNLLAPLAESSPPESTPLPNRSTVPPSSTPSSVQSTSKASNSSDHKKDDVVIYYYYYYDDDKNAKNDPNNGLDAIPSLEGFDGGVSGQSQPSSQSQSNVGKPPGKIVVKQPGDSPIKMTDPHSGANVKPLDISAILNPSAPNSENRPPTQSQQSQSSTPPQIQQTQPQQSQPSILPQITNHTNLVSNIFRYGNQQQPQSPSTSTSQAPPQLPTHFEAEKIQPHPIEKLPEPQIPTNTAAPALVSRPSTSQQFSPTSSARPRYTTTTTTTTTTTAMPSTAEASTTTESPSRRRFGNRRPGFGAPNRSTPSYRNRLSTTTTTTTTTPAPQRTFTRAPPVNFNPASVNIRRNRPLANNRFRRPQRPGFGSPVNDERHSGDDQHGNGDGGEQHHSSTSTTTTTTTAAPYRTTQEQSSATPRRFGNRGRYGGRGSYQPQPSTGRQNTEAPSSTTETALQSTTKRPSVYASRNRPQLRGGAGRLPFLRNRNRNQPEEQPAISSTTETPVAASVSAQSDDQNNSGGNDDAASAAANEPSLQSGGDSDSESQPAPGEPSSSSLPSSSTERPRIGNGRQRPTLFGNRPKPNLFGRRAPTPAQSA
uniref:Mucin-5AC-like n=1 Tax=Dermatophagoides pteronyssinus TaxID=6956 RepID=A0A6P6YIU6_DERPT|nr:mucin-5AC-like [Dermatophagoides pteronyssinus]